MNDFKKQFSMFTAMLFLFGAFLLLPVFHAHAADFSLGGLKISVGESFTKTSDVQFVGRSGGRAFVGGGVCTGYAYGINVADTFSIDALSLCAILSGTYDDGGDAKFGGAVGISPLSLFGGMAKTFIGYDLANNRAVRGGMTTLSAVVSF
ncbi:hypothetical protein [Candidatus Manganitrophus noduliformans]|uniref:Secreted protein n=1 Tax=Candidatus Manganitrophus noduliformans TaxID=2606439 RepID=A0A7X6DMC5_9BACT|nr:hypothetical protein [Candidatus Manganitrophus noduliformans]NKE69886.1 hypothetical protein [Candidatus Manganitrophus noduliformans]